MLLFLALFLWLLPAPSRAVSLPSGFQETIVLSDLTEPTALRFAADGRVFVAEKSGIIKVFASLGDATPTVFADFRTRVHNYFDRGLMNLALHPDFPRTPYVYVVYVLDGPIGATPPTYGTADATSDGCSVAGGCVVANRVSRLEAAGDVMTGTEHVLVEDWCQWYSSHSGGGLVFGPDGALYVSGGEGATATGVDYGQRSASCGDPPFEGGALRAQDLRTPGDPVGLGGSVIRIDPLSGLAPPDNPLAGSAGERIVAYGLRNPFRMIVRPGTSELWIGDVGWEDWEEIDRIAVPADRTLENFGWPCYEGLGHQPSYEAVGLPICRALYADAARGAVTAPRFTYRHKLPVVPGETCNTGNSAVTGLAFGAGTSFPPPFDRALFFADYSRGCIWALPADATGEPDPAAVTNFVVDAASPVDLQVGPDGDLYYADIRGGTIRRIHYFPGNQPPLVMARADVTNGPLPLTVHFDASGSRDPDSSLPLGFAWDLDGDGELDDSTEVAPTYTYGVRGSFVVRLRVDDAEGASATATIVISAGNSAPRPVITAPLAATAWRVGEVIRFAGSATDADDGTLAPAALSWALVLHHCPGDCHLHHLQDFPGVAEGTLTTLDHDYPSFLELRLTATDSGGLTTTVSVELHPRTVPLDFVTEPSGLELAAGVRRAAAPFTLTAIVGSALSVSAPTPQTLDGVEHEHFSWSDGGAASHDVTVPEVPAIYTARFLPPAGAAGCPGACGDGHVDPPCELCDLGMYNCPSEECCAAGCTSTCRPTGRCTASGGCCVTAADCPAGEGCCGNVRLEGTAETCDDGNLLDGDCCSAACVAEPAGCEPHACAALGPHLQVAGPVVGRLRGAHWSTRGAFRLRDGLTIDPGGEPIEMAVAQGGLTAYRDTSAPGAFHRDRARCPRTWRAARAGRFRQPRAAKQCADTISFALGGRLDATSVALLPGRLRQSLRVGDDCVSALLDCRAERKGRRLACRAR